VSVLVLVTWEVAATLSLGDLSATTWISGSCQTTDTTGKSGCLFASPLHSSISYLQFTSLLVMLLAMSYLA
jgi:hypothetical protein